MFRLLAAILLVLTTATTAFAYKATDTCVAVEIDVSVIKHWCKNLPEPEDNDAGWTDVKSFVERMNISDPLIEVSKISDTSLEISDIREANADSLKPNTPIWLPSDKNTREEILARIHARRSSESSAQPGTERLVDIKAMRKLLAPYDERISSLAHQVNALTDEVAEVSTQVGDVTTAVGTFATALETMNSRVDDLETAIDNSKITENAQGIGGLSFPWWWWIPSALLAVALALVAIFVWKNREKITEVEDTAKRAEAAAGKANGLLGRKDTGLVAAHTKADKAMLVATRAASEARINTNHDLPEGWVVLGDLPNQTELNNLPPDGVVLVRFGKLDADGNYVVEDKILSFTKIPDAFDRDGQPAPGLHVEGVIGLVKPIALRVGKILHVATNAIKSNHLVGIDKDGRTQQTKTAA